MRNMLRLSVLLDDLIQFQDPRPRDLQGQFERQGEGGPDPNAMATVYKMPQQQMPKQEGGGLGSTLLKGSALALTGGALGGIGGDIGKSATAKAKEILKRFRKK